MPATASSTTSSPTSTSWSTSEPATLVQRLAGFVRLTHPFPSILDGLVAAGIAFVAVPDVGSALRLGLSMTALQASIGTLNDVVDAAADAGRKPGKPIPAGLVTVHAARMVLVAAAVVGLALAAPSGGSLVVIATVGLAVGYAYDLWAKGTAWSWLPFVVGIPLLPLFGWYGAAGTVPDGFIALLPLAALAGAAIAIANARADLERDLAAGRTSVAVRLGLRRSWSAGAALTGLAVGLAIATLGVGAGAGAGEGVRAMAAVGAVVTAVGVALGWRGGPERRERAWEIQAVGLAVVGVGWVLAVAT